MAERDTRALPKWLQKWMRPDGLQRIADAIAQVETLTAAEIVPVVVRRSAVNSHVRVLAFLLLGWVASALILVAGSHFMNGYVQCFALLFGILFVAHQIGNSAWALRVFTPKRELLAQVHWHAELAFYRAHVDHTSQHTGVLIFVSLAERQAVVLTDQGIAQKLDQTMWQEPVTLVLKGAEERSLDEGFVAAIKRCGDVLAKIAPAQGAPRNQLSNCLVFSETPATTFKI